ncbi:putative N-acyltransferase [Flavobacterium gossypii]|uniref:Peptidoglycan biosynthesis/recognition protein n=2 Tax=Flavobacterium TaxID=237 RepID=A0A495MK14_9FLAO|nr:MULTISPECIES: peptidogalycan biosysnthesis protein [Flavobacterium]MBA9072754.1 putative N-acyltransferase [Flavobacterium gossypii]RKS25768.1 peptidoglycan biosynthesis/recognition protein [Flavobacterium endophyticum]
MKTTLRFTIFTTTTALPENWDSLASTNIFLSKSYLKLLETAAPENMTCHFIGLFNAEKLVGIALSQFLDLSQVNSYGERDNCAKTSIRKFIFKNFSSKVLIIGNNMLTGQNAFEFDSSLEYSQGLKLLRKASIEIERKLSLKGMKTHITVFKDFEKDEASHFEIPEFQDFYQFSTQPNMVFTIPKNWNEAEDYVSALNKKYRDQYKRARKKSEGLVKKKLSLAEIQEQEKLIYDLYYCVAKNAPFNTFYLPEKHFSNFKLQLQDNFLFYGYFENNKMIGFNTLIKNGDVIDTYFLGYDENCQKEKMLYLNMLYDMISHSINKGFKQIIFARTALEIKSSVGAIPEKMYGFIKHHNYFLNLFISRLFGYLEPETVWKERNPFK